MKSIVLALSAIFFATPAIGQENILTTDGFAPVWIGASTSPDVVDVSDISYHENPNECAIYPVWHYSDVYAFTEQNRITSVTIENPRIRTISGAHIGMTEGELRTLYGSKLVEEEAYDAGPRDRDLYVYSDSGRAIKFEVRGGVVIRMRAGEGSIQYYEGCV